MNEDAYDEESGRVTLSAKDRLLQVLVVGIWAAVKGVEQVGMLVGLISRSE